MGLSNVIDKPDRITAIAAEVDSPTRHELKLFRGQMTALPVVRLAIELPVYRMRNGRTQVEQYQYVEEMGQSKAFFNSGEENISAQGAQHDILVRLARNERGPIYQELERTATQKEALLLTSDGVVLNGNRRLAAMRELFWRDARTYIGFSHLDAAILPAEANEKDLELLEAELQMAPETKLEYGWVERRLKLRHHVEVLKIPRDQIKETYRFRREEDINVELQQLALAEEYLETYLKMPDSYRQVAQSEQLFANLEQQVRGKSGPEADLRRTLGFLLAKEAGNLGARVYQYNPIFGRDFKTVVDRYVKEEGIATSPTTIGNEVEFELRDEDDPLAGLSEVEPNPYSGLELILEDQKRTRETATSLARIYDSIREEEKDKSSRQAALRNVERANSALHSVDMSRAYPATFDRMRAQLNAIISQSNALISEITKLTDHVSMVGVDGSAD